MIYGQLRTVLLRVGLLYVVSILQISTAYGASGCEQYARNAVADAQQNLQNQCGFTGPRWGLDFQGHFGWCVDARQDSVDGEANARRNDLGNCSFCSNYVNEAIAAQQKNVVNGCGLSGPRWSDDRNHHFRWCIGARQDSVEQETRTRTSEAQKCEDCTKYSRAAVASNQQNLAKSCGFGGPQWNSDYAGHFNWCWKLETREALWVETVNRDNLLRRCETEATRKTECDQYARTAITQSAAYRQRNCGKVTTRWGDNYQNHYGWCLAVSSADAQRETAARNDELSRCGASGSLPPSESCSVSVIVKNRTCLNADGTESSILKPGSSSAIGCAAAVDNARARAKASLATQLCLTDGDRPAPGCCTYSEESVQGCLCR